MAKKKKKEKATPKPKLTSQERHARDCRVCNHPQREEIEREFTSWGDVSDLAKKRKLSRNSLYRHAEMMGLYQQRRRNIRAALERIIEKASSVEVTAAAVVSAIQAYAKINANGEWVERIEHVDLKAVFDRMTSQEMLAYATTGTLPAWAGEFLGATRAEAAMEESGG
jgi:hypothetical protein